MNLKTKLILGSMLFAVIPVGIAGTMITYLVHQETRMALEKQAKNHLIAIQEMKKEQIKDYFQPTRDQVVTFSNNHMIIDTMKGFKSTLWIAGTMLVLSVGLGWKFANTITKPIHTLHSAMQSIGTAMPMTKRVEITSQDEVGTLAQTYNALLDRIDKVNGQMEHANAGVAELAGKVMGLVAPMRTSIQEQAGQTTAVASASEKMSLTVSNVARNAQGAAMLAKEADGEAIKGGGVVTQTTEGMTRLARMVEESAQKVDILGKRSNQIGHVTEMINEIADQTNLLALNAAIEAARAGEQGRGFAVVADEVRKLAERTSRATREITEMIEAMQAETRTAVAVMKSGTQEAQTAVTLAQLSGESLSRIVGSVSEVTDRVTQIATAAEQQSEVTTGINGNIEQVASASKENQQRIETITQWVTHLLGYAMAVQWMAGQESGTLTNEPEASFARVSLEPGFLEQFYDTFIQSHPSFAPMFAKTDMAKQKNLLRTGIAMLLQFARGDEMSKIVLDRIIQRHKHIDLQPKMFQIWIDSLIKTLTIFDPMWSPGLETTWRNTLAKGIKYLSPHNKIEESLCIS